METLQEVIIAYLLVNLLLMGIWCNPLMSRSHQRKGTLHERNGHFEIWTTDGTSGYQWLPRNCVGNSRCMWGLVSQGYHRSPCFLRTGAHRYIDSFYRWWPYPCFERLYRTGRSIQRYRGEQA